MEAEHEATPLDLARDLAAEIFAPIGDVFESTYRLWAEGMTAWAIVYPVQDGERPTTLAEVSARLHDFGQLMDTLMDLEPDPCRDPDEGEDQTGAELGEVVRDMILFEGPGKNDFNVVAGIAACAVDDYLERLPSLCSPGGVDPALMQLQRSRWNHAPDFRTAMQGYRSPASLAASSI